MSTPNTNFPVLITSAAYINSEIASEYGYLPPAFLPFGHQRLIEAQLDILCPSSREIFLTIPESFSPSDIDLKRLEMRNVRLIPVPDGITLGASVGYALAVSGISGPFGILHGDTLIPDGLSNNTDVVGVATKPAHYVWEEANASLSELSVLNEFENDVLCGWFSFSSSAEFTKCLALEKNDFVAAIRRYESEAELSAEKVSNWLDFGHLRTFHQSRSKVNTARSFNEISISDRAVHKTGEKQAKLADEAHWFENLPPLMRIFTPTYLGRHEKGYRIGYEASPNLHELFIFGCLSERAWERIAQGCFEFLSECSAYKPESAPNFDLAEETLAKTTKRLKDWETQSGENLNQVWTLNGQPAPSLNEISERSLEHIVKSEPIHCLMHGDLCFTNMFYNFRQEVVKVIDPRGSLVEGKTSIFGDLRYDLAKLNHSLEGYDQILAGKYELEREGNSLVLSFATNPAEMYFRSAATSQMVCGISIDDKSIHALTIHLFLSMLPLHSDRPDRQIAFLANALRLFLKLEK